MTCSPVPAPIDSRKRADQVRERLVELIRDKQYQEGDKLPTEAQLMELFGVGRSSVRAAVQSLVGLGIVELRPGRGAYVCRLSVEDLVNIVQGAVRLEFSAALHLHEVRAMIETTAARLAARRRSESDLDDAREQIDRYATAHADANRDGAIDADIGFHRTLVVASRNPVLLSIFDSISGLLREHLREYGAHLGAAELNIVITEHSRILDALTKSDADLTVQRIGRHMRVIWKQIQSTVPVDHDGEIAAPETIFEKLPEES
jgi:DNA-binding FadR family transcriptional regulator